MMKTNNPKIVTVIQARMGSTRLPGKVLLDIEGKPLLLRMVERVKYAAYSGVVVVAASDNKKDDILENLCRANGIPVYRGNEEDLLDRHYRAAIEFSADAVVKIPSDCPLIDPAVIDKVIGFYIRNKDSYDFVSNLHPATYPDGNDVEIMSLTAIEKAWKNASKKFEREHTTPYIWENKDKFRRANIESEDGKDRSFSHKWSIDYEEDYLFIRGIYKELYHKDPKFGVNDILKLLEEKPELSEINKKHTGYYWYKDHLDELENIDEYKKKLEGNNG